MTRQNTSQPVAYDQSTRGLAILIGVMFLVATLTFLVGDALITAAFDASASTVKASDLAVGAILISIDAIAVAVIGVAAYRVLRSLQPGLALGYLILRILEGLAILVVVGYMVATVELVNYEAAIYVFTGVGGLMLAVALDRAGLIASWWRGWVSSVTWRSRWLRQWISLGSSLSTHLPGCSCISLAPCLSSSFRSC